ncbi:DUF4450 domain-containing protein [Chitinophaga agrisoli]|uniref:DUF4450 domain-containing protein n=1 Tax=Chitinophaga agrisoli TaxID=2607653 RepID=A0A5B2VNK5_9BACT|nr:DUF4450 domain-containing protein [Chitinophaga agrisoli]KAA2240681.1 DUF4450 domain-containing protein [Chitinophaga agrisoli]
MKNTLRLLLFVSLFIITSVSHAQELYPLKLSDKYWHNKKLELRYKPEGRDFVITNGTRLFTRALYGTNTAFRVETGDRPEFAFYMPGMGGTLKFGIGVNGQTKWLTQADKITARYRPGSRLYTIKDPLLGSGTLHIEILAMADAEGCIIKTSFENITKPVNLYWTFGGATGKKFSRDGDMGPDPESVFYLQPGNCKDNKYTIYDKGRFNLQYGAGERELTGTFAPNADLKIADAGHLNSPDELYRSTAEKAPVITGKLTAQNNQENYFAIHNPATKAAIPYSGLPAVFQQAATAREQLANRILVTTPDPFINTIGGAVSMASDAIWEYPSYMHGAIGWRMRLNGWRGPYTADVLGWHDRAAIHLSAYAASQFTSPAIGPVVPDTAMHLARSTEKSGIGMFSSGYISRDPDDVRLRPHHYDMNLVYIDALLRHYLWTGDTAFIKKTWPVLKRHLDWEIRNFDADGNGLFDAYAAIWASDALQYSGGDVTHTSAYNYFHFKKAAQIAAIIGQDPGPYLRQASKTLQAMNQTLWMPGKGTYAEFKDAMGNKLLHPAAALWSIYHSIDSEVPDPFQAFQSLRYIDNGIPHIPIRAKGLADSGYYTVSTTNWMPYQWSLNNVALAESMHLALANWEGGRIDEAFKLFKSEVLQSMYLGGSPGNIVQISYFDAIRGESYRDFADPIGMFSRALVEGLFGIVPNALDKVLTIRPGLPSAWNYASFATPDISFDFKRTGKTDAYTIVPKLPLALSLKLRVIAQGQVQNISLNGKSIAWKNVTDAVGKPLIEINAPSAASYNIKIVWTGAKPLLPSKESTYTDATTLTKSFPGASVLKVFDPQNVLQGIKTSTTGFSAAIHASEGDHTVFVQLRQGGLSWWMPICFKVAPAIELISWKDPEENSNIFYLQNNTQQNSSATIQVNDFRISAQTGANITIPESDLLPGTNKVNITYGNGKTISTQLIDWNGHKQPQVETIDLSNYFNDQLTQIFKNKYLSPRPQATTLQLPWQGIGDWPKPLETFDVDDSGLRKTAGEKNGIILTQGIRFRTPGNASAKNILFTSQWDNYPHEATIPLSGKAAHAWFLMAGSTNPMQSQLTNGEVIVRYTDGTADTLVLRNPETWWPIDQDYYTDGFAFALKTPRPIRVHVKTGNIVTGESSEADFNGKKIPGGAATVLDLPLDATKTLQDLTLKTITNDVVIGLMAVTLQR